MLTYNIYVEMVITDQFTVATNVSISHFDSSLIARISSNMYNDSYRYQN